MLRDWTDCLRLDGISPAAERLFVRLIMKVDDYGRFHADPRLVKGSCFPLCTDVGPDELVRWMDELRARQLIVCYEVGGQTLLAILNFGQRLRQSRAKFPPPVGEAPDYLPLRAADGRITPKVAVAGTGESSPSTATGGELRPGAANGGGLPSSVAASGGNSPQVAADRGDSRPEGEVENEGEVESETEHDLEAPAAVAPAARERERQSGEQERMQQQPSAVNKEQPSQPPSIPPVPPTPTPFARFWEAYPRKVAKGDAEKAWKTHKCEPLIETILAAVLRWRDSFDWKKEGGQFIPYPCTWLNRRGWEDQLPSGVGAGAGSSAGARREAATTFPLTGKGPRGWDPCKDELPPPLPSAAR